MPPSLRLNMLHHGQVACLAEGLTAMAAFAAKLDAVCASLGVAAVSSFFDRTDANADLDELDLLIDDGSHLAEQGVWHDAAALLATVQALHQELTARPRRFGVLTNKYAAIMDELTRCATTLANVATNVAAASETRQVHLLVLG